MDLVCSGLEYFDDPDDVLSADGALVHELSASGAGAHVAALQHDAVHRRVHANLAQLVVLHLVLA